MRRFLFFLLAAVLAGLPLWAEEPEASGEDVEFVEARTLFWSAQYVESEKLFKIYLIAHPGHGPSKSFLQMIDQYRRHTAAGADGSRQQIYDTRKHLESIILPRLEIKSADWRDVSSHLQELANPKKDGKDPKNYVNFINLLPTGMTVKISIDLRNVTLLEVIDYCCREAGFRFVVDAWAVIIDLPESRKK